MSDDLGPIRSAIQKAVPVACLETVGGPELEAIRRQYPGVPESYLEFLRQVGYGSLGGAFMIYSGPVEPEEIFPTAPALLDDVVFVGDNLAGTLMGFDTRNGWRLVRVDDHTFDVEPEQERSVGEFITRLLAEWSSSDGP